MTSAWRFDIENAPRGRMVATRARIGAKEVDAQVFQPERVILATKCGKVTRSQFLPDQNRWEMLGKNEQPVAWQRWPEHPYSLRPSPPSAADEPGADPTLSASGAVQFESSVAERTDDQTTLAGAEGANA